MESYTEIKCETSFKRLQKLCFALSTQILTVRTIFAGGFSTEIMHDLFSWDSEIKRDYEQDTNNIVFPDSGGLCCKLVHQN